MLLLPGYLANRDTSKMHARNEFTQNDRLLVRFNTVLLLCVVAVVIFVWWRIHTETKVTRELIHQLRNAPEEIVKKILMQIPHVRIASSVLETLDPNNAIGEGILNLKDKFFNK